MQHQTSSRVRSFPRRSWLFAVGIFLGVLAPATLPAAPIYSTHPPYAGKTKTVPVFIDPDFSAAEQEQIQSAIEEWNRALNGVARLDRAASADDQPDGKRPWVIRKAPGKDGISELGRKGQNLATVQPLLKGGGILIVFAGASEYLRQHGLTLRDVMMRELGHLVGLRHAIHTELLGHDYQAGDRSCVDLATALEVAQSLGVPVEALNWCEPPGR